MTNKGLVYQPLVSNKVDILIIGVFGLIVFILTKAISTSSIILLLALLVAVVLDDGHVFTTYSRVFKEFNYEKLFFISSVVGIFALSFLWLHFKIPYFWSFVIYFMFFHYARQTYGIHKWYLYKENKNHFLYDLIIYSIAIFPLLSLHVNPNFNFNITMYNGNDLFLFKSQTLFYGLISLFIFIVLLWIVLEIYMYKKHKTINVLRIIYIAGNGLMFFLVGTLATNPFEVVIPLKAFHGAQYIALSIKAENTIHKIPVKKAFILILSIAIIFGGIFYYLSEYAYDLDNTYLYTHSLFNDLLVALVITPVLTHYVYDMKIWKSSYIQKVLNK